MGWWTALKGTMGTRRADRIAREDADQLLAGQPAGPSHAGLAALLSDAAAPPRQAELTGEADAVAGFRRLRSATPTIVDLSTVDVGSGGRHRLGRPPWRAPTIRLAVAVLLLAAAGTASITLAFRQARTQPTPTPVASSSVPAPSPSLSPSGLRRQPPPGSPASPSLEPSPASFVTGTGDLATATRLCEAWSAATDTATRDLLADQLQTLIDRLDGPHGLPAFCRKLVGADPTTSARTTATKASPQATASAPTTTTKVRPARVAPAAAASTKANKGD